MSWLTTPIFYGVTMGAAFALGESFGRIWRDRPRRFFLNDDLMK